MQMYIHSHFNFTGHLGFKWWESSSAKGRDLGLRVLTQYLVLKACRGKAFHLKLLVFVWFIRFANFPALVTLSNGSTTKRQLNVHIYIHTHTHSVCAFIFIFQLYRGPQIQTVGKQYCQIQRKRSWTLNFHPLPCTQGMLGYVLFFQFSGAFVVQYVC